MKKVFDTSGFPVITVRLPYVLLTAKVNARGNHAVTVWVGATFKLKFAGLR